MRGGHKCREILRILLAGILCLALLVPRTVLAKEDPYPPLAHETIGEEVFTDLAMDPAVLKGITERIDTVLAGSGPDRAQELASLYGELLAAYDDLVAKYVLTEYAYAKNVNDEAMRAKQEEAGILLYDLVDAAVLSVQKILADPDGAFLAETLSDDLLEEIRTYKALTEEDKDRRERINTLVNDYRSVMSREFTVTYDGREWNADDITSDGSLDYETRAGLYMDLCAKENEAAGPIYKELVTLYTEEAKENGYEDYTAYAHEKVHGRDYTAEDLERFSGAVKKDICALSEEYEYALYSMHPDTDMFEGASQEDILDAVEPWIDDVAPELDEAYAYMRENRLADIAEDPNREDGAFTSTLSKYHAAVMLINAYGSYWDYKTLVHEFGHFNAAYHNPEHALWNASSTDVAEVQSQGLEVLFLPYWSKIAGDEETGGYFTAQVLGDMLYAVVTGCMYNECETYAFTHPEESLDEWNRAFGRIFCDYGYSYLTKDGAAFQWVEVGHLFEAPLYYISYATSAMAALTIWSDAEEDREAATKEYLKVSACTNEMFMEMLGKCGLPDVFAEDTVREVCDRLRFVLYGEEEREGEARDPAQSGPFTEEPVWEEEPEEVRPEEEASGNGFENPDGREDLMAGAAALCAYFVLRWTAIAVMLLVLERRRRKRLAQMGLDKNGRRIRGTENGTPGNLMMRDEK